MQRALEVVRNRKVGVVNLNEVEVCKANGYVDREVGECEVCEIRVVYQVGLIPEECKGEACEDRVRWKVSRFDDD